MNCPLCKVPMQQINISGVVIDECDNCHGLWFDSHELSRLDELHEGSGEDLDRILSYPRAGDSRREPLTCPRCTMKMKQRNYFYRSGINIDECYGCGGIWLDAGELRAIRENFKDAEERVELFETMISDHPDYQQLKAQQSLLQQQTEKLRQKGLLKNLFKICFWR